MKSIKSKEKGIMHELEKLNEDIVSLVWRLPHLWSGVHEMPNQGNISHTNKLITNL